MKKYIKFNKCEKIDESILITLDNNYKINILAPDGEKLYLVCVIPVKKIENLLISNGFLVNENNLNKYIYVFSYYLEDEYFLDSITYNGSEEEYLSIKSGYTKIIIEDEGYIDISKDNLYEILLDDQGDQGSWFGGSAEFLQNENHHFSEDYLFLAQINGLDLPSKLDDLFYLNDAVGYIYLKRYLTDGLFFVQNT